MANTTIPSELIQASVALGGSPTTTTQSASDNTTKIATTAYVTAAVNALIDSAPGTMNTLNEIAAALNDDAAFNTTVTNAIATKLPLGGGTMTGNLIVNASLDISGDIDVDGTTNLDVVDIDGAVDMASTLTMSAGGTISAGGANDLVLNAGASGTPDIYLQSGGATKVKIEGSNGAVGIGTSSPTGSGTVLHVNGSSTVADFHLTNSTSGAASTDGFILRYSGLNAEFLNREAGSNIFYTSGTERLRIDSSGNVGIGSASPQQKLVVSDGGGYGFEFAPNNSSVNQILSYDRSADVYRDFKISANQIILGYGQAGANEAMRIDSSGNLIVGGTAALGGAKLSIDHSGAAIIGADTSASSGGYIQLLASGTSKGLLGFGSNAGASSINNVVLRSQSGDIEFHTNGANERMRIGSTGKITTRGTTASGYGVLEFGTININSNLADNVVDFAQGLAFTNNVTNEGAWTQAGICATGSSGYNGSLVFGTDGNSSRTSNTITERMRIDSSGNVGIGTASPRGLLEVGNAAGTTDVDQKLYITGDQVNASGNFATLVLSNSNRSGSSSSQISAGRDTDNIGTNLQFYTHPTSGSETERMRIDSSGKLLVGKTVPTFGSGTSTDGFTFFQNGTFHVQANAAEIGNFNRRGTDGVIFNFWNDLSLVGNISVSGSSTAYNTSSDYRLKENVNYTFNALNRVAQLKPARFNFIADADTTVDGFIAHEVQDIIPEAVTGEKDAVDDEGNPVMQGIDQSKLVPLLTKAIQEQQTLIESLTARIETLEG